MADIARIGITTRSQRALRGAVTARRWTPVRHRRIRTGIGGHAPDFIRKGLKTMT